MQKIEDYNQVARRYRALANAELQITIRDLQNQITQERSNGTYVEPGLDHLARYGAIAAWGSVLIWSLVSLSFAPVTAALSICSAGVVGGVIHLGCWNKQADDPRIAAAKRLRRNAHTYWNIL